MPEIKFSLDWIKEHIKTVFYERRRSRKRLGTDYDMINVIRTYSITVSDLTVFSLGDRIVIPSVMRIEMLDRVHDGHQGISKCCERAKRAIWWPGSSHQIKDMVTTCRKCVENRTNPKETLMLTPMPDRPCQIIGTDVFYLNGRHYLIIIDYFQVPGSQSLLDMAYQKL